MGHETLINVVSITVTFSEILSYENYIHSLNVINT